MRDDDHPIRTIFVETVARRCSMSIKEAEALCEDCTTADIDERWPLEEIVQRGMPLDGMLRPNHITNTIEVYRGGEWRSIQEEG